MPNPTVTIDISSVEARRGAGEVRAQLDAVRASVTSVNRDVQQLNSTLSLMGRGQSAGAGMAAEIQKQQAAIRGLVQTQRQARSQEKAIEADRVRAARQQSRLDAERLRSRQQAERAALTALSTLGSENRAFAQRIQFERRLKLAVDQGIISQQRANQLRQRANTVFSTQSVRARDLRLNMLGLNTSVRNLTATMSTLAFGPLSGVGSRMLALNSAVDAGGLRLVAFTAAAAGAVAGVALLVKGYIDATRTAAEFEQGLADLSAITGLQGDALTELGETAVRIASVTTSTATEVATGFKLVGSARPQLLESAAALSDVTREAIILSQASGEDLPTSVRALVDVMNQFKAPASEASRIINVLAAGSLRGAVEIPNLSQGFSKFGSAAEAVNLTVEETTALLEAVGQFGLPIQQVGTSLRNIFIVLAGEAEALNPGIVGLETALDNLAARVGEGPESLVELTALFGRENAIVASQLVQSRDRVLQLRDAVTDTTTAYEQSNTRIDTLRGDVKLLASAWEALQITVSDTSAFRTATQELTDAVNTANRVISGAGQFELVDDDALLAQIERLRSEAERLGAVDFDPLNIGERFNDLSVLGERAVFVVASLGEAMRELAARTNEAGVSTGTLTAAQLEALGILEGGYVPAANAAAGALDTLTDAQQQSVASLADVITSAERFREQLDALRTGGEGALALEKDIQKARKEVERLDAAEKKLLATTLGLGRVTENELVAAYREQVTEERKAKEALDEFTESTKRATDASRKHALGVTRLAESIAKTDRERRKSIELLRDEIEATRRGEAAVREFAIEKAGDLAVERQLEEARRAKVTLTREQIEETRRLAEQEAALKQELEDVRDNSVDVFGDLNDEIRKLFSDTFRDVLDDGLDSFDDFADKVLDIFIDLGAQIARQLLLNAQIQITGGAVGGQQPGGILFAPQGPLGTLGGTIGLPRTGVPGGTPPTVPGPAPSTGIGTFGTVALATGGSALAARASGDATEGPLGQVFGGLGAVGGSIAGFSVAGPPGAFVGSFIGAFAGAEFGALLDDLFGFTGSGTQDKPKVAPLTVQGLAPEDFQRVGAPGGIGFETGIFAESPFGFVGAARSSRKLSDAFLRGFADFLLSIDEALAENLSPAEIERVADAVLGQQASFRSTVIDEELAFIAQERINDVLGAVFGDAAGAFQSEIQNLKIDTLPGQGKVGGKPTQQQVNDFIEESVGIAATAIAERASLIQSLDDLISPPMLTEIQQALDAVADAMDAMRIEAERLNVSLDKVAEAEAAARAQIGEGFRESVEQQILQLTDADAFARAQLELDLARRVREAETLIAEGILDPAFLDEVERLNALQREALENSLAATTATGQAEQAEENIRSFLDSLFAGPQSPLAPEIVLGNALNLFNKTAAAAQGGDVDALAALPAAAQGFLAASDIVNASSAAFFEDFALVTSTLEDLLPGGPISAFGSAIVDVVSNTAASVEVEERMLSAIERMEEEIRDLRAQLERRDGEIQRLALAAA